MIVLRPVRMDDALALVSIFNHSVEHSISLYSSAPRTLEEQQKQIAEKIASDWPFITADLNGEAVGYANYGPFRTGNCYSRVSVENSVYVSPHHLRKGLARQLMVALIDAAAAQGVRTMVAGIDSENMPSIALHHALGFTEAGFVRQVARKLDQWRDLIFMQKIFEH